MRKKVGQSYNSVVATLLLAPLLAFAVTLSGIWRHESLLRLAQRGFLSYELGLAFALAGAGLLDQARLIRLIELILACVGVGASIALLVSALLVHDQISAVSAILLAGPSIAFLVPRRGDTIKSGAFFGVAVETYVTGHSAGALVLTSVLGMVALVFLVRATLHPTHIRLRANFRIAAGILAIGICLFFFTMAYRLSSLSGMLIFGTGILLFGGGMTVMFLRGEYQ